jgi:hypothetical protein
MELLNYLAPFLAFLLLQTTSPALLRAQVNRTAPTDVVTDQSRNRVPQCTYARSPGVYSVRFVKDGFAPFVALNVSRLKPLVMDSVTSPATKPFYNLGWPVINADPRMYGTLRDRRRRRRELSTQHSDRRHRRSNPRLPETMADFLYFVGAGNANAT